MDINLTHDILIIIIRMTDVNTTKNDDQLHLISLCSKGLRGCIGCQLARLAAGPVPPGNLADRLPGCLSLLRLIVIVINSNGRGIEIVIVIVMVEVDSNNDSHRNPGCLAAWRGGGRLGLGDQDFAGGHAASLLLRSGTIACIPLSSMPLSLSVSRSPSLSICYV